MYVRSDGLPPWMTRPLRVSPRNFDRFCQAFLLRDGMHLTRRLRRSRGLAPAAPGFPIVERELSHGTHRHGERNYRLSYPECMRTSQEVKDTVTLS